MPVMTPVTPNRCRGAKYLCAAPPALVKATMLLLLLTMTMIMFTCCFHSTPVQGIGVNQPMQHPPSDRYEQSPTDVTAYTFDVRFNRAMIPATATGRTWNQSSVKS